MSDCADLCKGCNNPLDLAYKAIKKRRLCRLCINKYTREYKVRQRREKGILGRGEALYCGKGHPMFGENLVIRKDGKRRCQACHRIGETARNRKAGAKEWIRQTREQKLEQKRKWEATRKALKMKRFVEVVEPGVVFEKSNGICGVCQQPVDRLKFEVDHIIPLSRGGEHSYLNTQASHPTCNRKKWANIPIHA